MRAGIGGRGWGSGRLGSGRRNRRGFGGGNERKWREGRVLGAFEKGKEKRNSIRSLAIDPR